MAFQINVSDMASALVGQGKPLTFFDDGDPDHNIIIQALNVARGWGFAVVHHPCVQSSVPNYLSKVKSILRVHVAPGETLIVRYNEHERNSDSIAFEIICRGLSNNQGEEREKASPFTKHIDEITHKP